MPDVTIKKSSAAHKAKAVLIPPLQASPTAPVINAKLEIIGFTDLGDGYAIIKGAFNRASSVAIPVISEAEINSILKKSGLELPSAQDSPAPQAKPKRPSKRLTANQAFMQKMKQGEEKYYEELLRTGSLLTPDQFWQGLAISRQAVSKAVKEKRMFAIEGANGQMLYPAFFADPKYDRRQLAKISQALGDLPGSSKFHFFTTGKMSLAGKTPLAALADGELKKVLISARGYAER